MKKRKTHAYTIMLAIIMIVAILTWIIPAGNYEKIFDSNIGRDVLIPNSFQYMESTPVTPWHLLICIFRGFVDSAFICFFLIFAFGYVNILISTKALDAFISMLLKKFESKSALIVSLFIIIFAICGSTLGMFEVFLGFVPAFMLLAIALGYDKMVGGSIIIIGGGVGLAAATLNPFSIGLASSIANVPLATTNVIVFRVVSFIVFISITVIYILNYARKVQINAMHSIVYNDENNIIDDSIPPYNESFSIRQKLTLYGFVLIIAIISIGVIVLDFSFEEVAAIFFLFMIITGLLNRYSLNSIFEKFIDSSKESIFVVLMVGFGRAIQVVIIEGNIIDTIVYSLSNLVTVFPREISAIIMLFIQNIICFFVPSASGQAVLSIPILAPVADLAGLSRQIVVITYQFGNGFAGLFWPISAAAICGIMKIGLDKWYKFFGRLFCYFIVAQVFLVIIAVVMNI